MRRLNPKTAKTPKLFTVYQAGWHDPVLETEPVLFGKVYSKSDLSLDLESIEQLLTRFRNFARDNYKCNQMVSLFPRKVKSIHRAKVEAVIEEFNCDAPNVIVSHLERKRVVAKI